MTVDRKATKNPTPAECQRYFLHCTDACLEAERRGALCDQWKGILAPLLYGTYPYGQRFVDGLHDAP